MVFLTRPFLRTVWLCATLATLMASACRGGHPAAAADAAAQVIHGIAVPPQPDPENNGTLTGVDANHNGVRDDVDRYIARKYGASASRYAAALQMAQATQATVAANGNTPQATQAQIAAVQAGACAYAKFGHDAIAASHAADDITAVTLNTRVRFAAFTASVKASTQTATTISATPCR
jgi:hypothetical protein